MSNTTDVTEAIRAGTTCRIAYTLDKRQPVLCTLLGSDPFFFDVDPDALADDFDALLNEESSYEIPEALRLARDTSDGFVTLAGESDELLLSDDTADLCRNALKPAPAFNLDAARALLTLSETGRRLLDQADAMELRVRGDAATNGVRSDLKTKTILINPALPCEAAALLIGREIRRAELLSVHDALRNPESAILIHRTLQAELLTLPVQIAWELNLAGDKSCWNLLSASPLADLAYAYGQRASSDFRALRDGRAAMASFDQWFYSGRTRKADRALIQHLLSLGDAATCAGASAQKTLDALRLIGERGLGRNYLIDNIAQLMQDGFYGDVRDRSNANFLWFVKFERSYRAAEAYIDHKTAVEKVEGGAKILAFPDLFTKRVAKRGKKAGAPIVDLTARRS